MNLELGKEPNCSGDVLIAEDPGMGTCPLQGNPFEIF